jgi:hypothetical protein
MSRIDLSGTPHTKLPTPAGWVDLGKGVIAHSCVYPIARTVEAGKLRLSAGSDEESLTLLDESKPSHPHQRGRDRLSVRVRAGS